MVALIRSMAVAAAIGSQLVSALPSNSKTTTTAQKLSPTVTLDAGLIVGTVTTVPSATASVYQYLGVPFAQSPPVRFSPPQKVASWKGVKQTVLRAPACMEQFMGDADAVNITKTVFAFPDAVESEDCLYLNVFVPSTKTKGRAVMNWLFPGNLFFGDASRPLYDGSQLAAKYDVIVVAGNYRTNAFGFSNSPEIPTDQQNAGFYDQRLVLDWIQRNIAAFGGDPDRVTIFGESSGASSVDRLVATNNAPFAAAIAQSGSASVSIYPNVNPTAWSTLVAAVNCTSAASQLACVRKVDAFTIKSIIESQAIIFPPANDGITQLATPLLNQRTQHRAAYVPYMMGNNGGEGYPFMIGFDSLEEGILYDIYNPTDAQTAEIEAAYPVVNNTDGTSNVFDVVSQLFTDVYFQCPVGLITRASANAGYPTWRYFFNQSYPNLQVLSDRGIDLHSYHTIEAYLIFGTYPTAGATEAEIAMSNFFQLIWTNFAKNPWAGPGWRPVAAGGSATSKTLDIGQIGQNDEPCVTMIDANVLDNRCGIYSPQYSTVTYAAF